MITKANTQKGPVEDPVAWYTRNCGHDSTCVDCRRFEGSVHQSAQMILDWAEAIYELDSRRIGESSGGRAAGVEGLAFAIATLARELVGVTVSPENADELPKVVRGLGDSFSVVHRASS